MGKRTIAVVTGARADYGVLYEPIRAIEAHPDLACQLVVTGSHLAPSQGRTMDQVVADGVPIAAQVEMLLDDDSDAGTGISIGLGVMGLTREFRRLQPDIVLLLGDRFEALAAAIAAMSLRIPVAHIAGGETDWANCLDGNIRNAITKIASLHFVSHETYAKRVAAMGEEPWRISTVGLPSLDNITDDLLSREELEEDLGITIAQPLILATYLPVVLRPEESHAELGALIEAVESFPEATVVFTEANADAGGHAINNRLRAWTESRANAHLFPALGRRRYLSAMAIADALLGNTSSGIIEAPSFGVPVVNVGIRQAGRIHPDNVLDVPGTRDAIAAALSKALHDDASKQRARATSNPFGDGGASERICEVLATVSLDEALLEKRIAGAETE